MSNEAYHIITIKVPVPANSTAGALAVMNGYLAEFEALKAKLPEGSETEDHISKPRSESVTPHGRKPKAVPAAA